MERSDRETNNQSFLVGDQVPMHVDVSGPLSHIDEIRFITQKEDEADMPQKISKMNEETTYWFNWFPNKPGAYKLKALGYKNGSQVNNVALNVIVIDNFGSAKVEFASLNSGDKYTTGEKVKMDVILTGNLSQLDQIQYLTKLGDGEFIVQKTEKLSDASAYFFDWMPTVGGIYSFRVTALKDGKYVTHVVAGGIEVEEDINPAKVEFASLNSGDKYTTGEKVKMDVILTGNLSQLDQIQYLTKQGDGEFIVQKTETLSNLSTYFFDWMPTVGGIYSFRVTALKDGKYVTHVVAGGIEVEEGQLSSPIPMHVELSGDFSDADEIRFMTKREDEDFIVQNTAKVDNVSTVSYTWVPNDAGKYALRVTAYKDNDYVTHVVVADIMVEDSLVLKYTVLKSGAVYNVGDQVKVHVEPKTWIPTVAGTYQLKVKAFNSGSYVTNVVAHITVNESDSY